MTFGRIEANVPLLHEELSGFVRQTAFEVHQYFGPGFLEKVHANALAHRLRKKGVEVQQGQALLVHDEDGTVVGEYQTDLLVDGRALVEVKAAKCVVGGHVAQLLHYLKATGTRLGLLVNFGAPKLELDRTSCPNFLANQLRVLATATAYVLFQELRLRARRTELARAQVSTLRERLLEIGARVVESVRRVVLHFPAAYPWRSTWKAVARAGGAVLT